MSGDIALPKKWSRRACIVLQPLLKLLTGLIQSSNVCPEVSKTMYWCTVLRSPSKDTPDNWVHVILSSTKSAWVPTLFGSSFSRRVYDNRTPLIPRMVDRKFSNFGSHSVHFNSESKGPGDASLDFLFDVSDIYCLTSSRRLAVISALVNDVTSNLVISGVAEIL